MSVATKPRPRLIPVLLLENRQLVKSVAFGKARYVGDPINAVKIFNEKEADELIILDRSRRTANAPPDFEFIERLASETFMPFSYGGGINSIDDMQRLFDLGVEKTVLCSALRDQPNLLTEASERFGRQSVAVCVDVKRTIFGGYQVCNNGKKRVIDRDIVAYVRKLERFGAGEIVLQSIDRDGTYKGYDTDLIAAVASAVNLPVVACGGAAHESDFVRAFRSGAAAAAASSLFVFYGPHQAVLIQFPNDQERRRIIDAR